MCATECMESNTGSGGTGVPSPPKSSLSPEVISESNTTSSEDKITAPLTADESVSSVMCMCIVGSYLSIDSSNHP